MSSELIGGVYTREFLNADFEKTIANQSLYAELSKKRKMEERRSRNMNLYVRQQLLHNKYKPSAEMQARIDEYAKKHHYTK